MQLRIRTPSSATKTRDNTVHNSLHSFFLASKLCQQHDCVKSRILEKRSPTLKVIFHVSSAQFIVKENFQ
jgi:hypothetical protein